MAAPFLHRLFLKDNATLVEDEFPGNLPFITSLDLHFSSAVTFFVGENGSGKSTVMEAIAEICGLPVEGGGRNEIRRERSELAPYVRGSFARKPRDGYFFRAEFQSQFANLLDERKADPDFMGDPYARYGGRSLHSRSHGEAFLQVFSSWLAPGLILMDEPEAALSPQRQLVLLRNMAKLVEKGGVQLIVATHSPIILTFPNATIMAFESEHIEPTTLGETSHYQITKGILDSPERYWRHLLAEDES